jgi:hypothetical protein
MANVRTYPIYGPSTDSPTLHRRRMPGYQAYPTNSQARQEKNISLRSATPKEQWAKEHESSAVATRPPELLKGCYVPCWHALGRTLAPWHRRARPKIVEETNCRSRTATGIARLASSPSHAQQSPSFALPTKSALARRGSRRWTRRCWVARLRKPRSC